MAVPPTLARAARRCLGAIVCGLLFASCTTLRADVARPRTQAIADPTTTLARAFAAPLASHPGTSGVAILEDGPLAWLSRVALADLAERTLDVQYYIYEADDTGLLLLQRLAAAADRGVRVRLLIDDNNLVGRDLQLARIDRHPNIEVRVFNPLRFRERWTRPLQYVFDLARANRRMHNKIFAADATAAIVGGRNIGDNYFEFDRAQPNFRDVDLLVVGPAAFEVASAFDLYWNSPWAWPARALVHRDPTREESQRLLRALESYSAQNQVARNATRDAARDPLQALRAAHESLLWAPVEVVVDAPAKVAVRDAPRSRVAERINAEWDRTRRELLIESAYLVPRRAGMERFADARARGVAIRVLTNSLSSTDVAAVHAGYRKRRGALLEMGVELYEFRREAAPEAPRRRRLRDRSEVLDGRSSEASLHSKVMVFDRRVAWVGSFNLDPRSRALNTEIGLFVRSPELAERLADLVVANFEPERSWKVEIEAEGPRRRLVWLGERDGVPVREYEEPDTTWQLRWLVDVLALLPGVDALL